MSYRPNAAGRIVNGSGNTLYGRLLSLGAGNKPRRRTQNDELTHPLLGDQPTLQLLPSRNEVGTLSPANLVPKNSCSHA